MTDLLSLADRVEAAMGADRELDGWIHVLLNPDARTIVGQEPGRFPQAPIYGPLCDIMEHIADKADAAQYIGAPAYTGSIDEAMKLVDPGCGFNLDRYWNKEGERWSCVLSFGGLPSNPRRTHEAWDAVSAPLAITAAALRARAAQGEG